MKKGTLFACLFLSVALILSGCGASNAVKGGGIGAGAGAAVGAGIGALLGGSNKGKGAAIGAGIGAAVGGTAGALIGNKMDKQAKELAESVKDAQVETVNDGQAIKVTFDSGILFALNKADLSTASKTSLTNFANSLKANPDTDVEIYGHTDSNGGDKINVPLSEKRAASVQTYLAGQGISSARMVSFGMGSSQPVVQENAKGVAAENRRVEIYILPNAKMVQEAEAGTLK
ncbi:OmpA family protein [Bacteroidales bacterium OttesenSCG-928-I14]|nr:OmpA family protein [Bacteroidales bacterium OttesenSCG-928-I14]